MSWNLNEIKEAALSRKLMDSGSLGSGPLIVPGREVILTFTSRPPDITGNKINSYIDIQDCEVVPQTKENLAAVQRGIRQDIFPNDRNVWP